MRDRLGVRACGAAAVWAVAAAAPASSPWAEPGTWRQSTSEVAEEPAAMPTPAAFVVRTLAHSYADGAAERLTFEASGRFSDGTARADGAWRIGPKPTGDERRALRLELGPLLVETGASGVVATTRRPAGRSRYVRAEMEEGASGSAAVRALAGGAPAPTLGLVFGDDAGLTHPLGEGSGVGPVEWEGGSLGVRGAEEGVLRAWGRAALAGGEGAARVRLVVDGSALEELAEASRAGGDAGGWRAPAGSAGREVWLFEVMSEDPPFELRVRANRTAQGPPAAWEPIDPDGLERVETIAELLAGPEHQTAEDAETTTAEADERESAGRR